ncbi:MAG: hypothetical protein KJP21_08330 [Bacteroidia bacterium]|nr:hypothetical protein [Bacteroidia bacterium]
MAKSSNFLYKLIRYEYWPWYCMFIPLVPIYIYGIIRTRKLLYFTAANPSIDMGGFFGEKKNEILDLIPDNFKVRSIHVVGDLSDDIQLQMEEAEITFPVIAKPNVGERGYGVRKIDDMKSLVRYAHDEDDFLIQEYVTYPLELGVMYCRYPDSNEGFVSSITEKNFLSVVGDGTSDVESLLMKHPRGRMYLNIISMDYPDRMRYVPAKHENYVVHHIGNHAKGTQFLNGNANLGTAINEVFTQMSTEVHGVFYGRYDLKVPSYADLLSGRNIKIFEMNGVSSEPGHIYDLPNVFLAYKELSNHWLIIIKIAKQNIKKGVKPTPFKPFFNQVKNHFLA